MKILTLILIICLAGMFAGCSVGSVMDTEAQRDRRIEQITDLQMRMLVDDWDYFWLYERNSMLTQWHTRVGI